MKQLIFFGLGILAFSCGESDSNQNIANDSLPNVDTTQIIEQRSELEFSFEELTILDSNEHYRGLYWDIESHTGWVAGSNGSVLLLTYNESDGIFEDGRWNLDSLHLRDVERTNNQLFALSIASPGYIKEFDPESDNWITRVEILDTNVFMDGMAFWENGKGLVYGDPLDDYHFVLRTEDYGQNWTRIASDQLPAPVKDEAGFAASGTGVVCVGDGVGYIAWGGEKARVFKTTDYGLAWEVQETPILHGKAGLGIYCMAWKNELEGVIAGGNWENPEGDSCYAYTKDGGASWHLGEGGSGYRSGICHSHDDVYFSVGTNGTDVSLDGGATWKKINELNLNSIQSDPNLRMAIAIGSYGKAMKVTF